MNLSPGIAVTQNFVCEAQLAYTFDFLKNKPEQVSGFSKAVNSPYELFKQRMVEKYPGLMKDALTLTDKNTVSKKRKWREISRDKQKEEQPGLFGFAFGSESQDVP